MVSCMFGSTCIETIEVPMELNNVTMKLQLDSKDFPTMSLKKQHVISVQRSGEEEEVLYIKARCQTTELQRSSD